MRETTRGPNRGRLWLAAAAVLAVLVLAAFLPSLGSSLGERLEDRRGIPTARVEAGRFVRRVPAEGALRAVQATPIFVPPGVPGPFRIGWLAPDGSRVEAGEVVVRFDPSEIEKELRSAEDDLADARLRIGKEEVQAGAELEKLASDVQLAKLELEQSRQFQKKDDLIFSRSEIIESEIDSELAEQRAEHARASRRTRQSLTGTEMGLLGIKTRQARAKIDRARTALSALSVAAPYDGVLVLKRNWRGEPVRVGDSVWNGQPIAEIPDLSRMEAEVFVLEADAGGLAAGQPVEVTLEAHPGTAYAGKIARVDSLAKPRLRGSPVQYFAVVVALDRTDPARMKPGQRVRATIVLDEREEALTVPRQAVFEKDGEPIVYRRAGGGFEASKVALGPSGMGRVVVESGLAPGDVIALRNPARAAEGEEEEGGEENGASPGGLPMAGGGAR
jgi:HlyD family secretion protein